MASSYLLTPVNTKSILPELSEVVEKGVMEQLITFLDISGFRGHCVPFCSRPNNITETSTFHLEEQTQDQMTLGNFTTSQNI